MNFEPRPYLENANDSIDAAAVLFQNSLFKGSLNRSYYAVFYCIQALLLSENVFAKTHAGLKTKFSEHFVKTGRVSQVFALQFEQIFQDRLSADYDLTTTITKEEAEYALSFAKAFWGFTSTFFYPNETF